MDVIVDRPPRAVGQEDSALVRSDILPPGKDVAAVEITLVGESEAVQVHPLTAVVCELDPIGGLVTVTNGVQRVSRHDLGNVDRLGRGHGPRLLLRLARARAQAQHDQRQGQLEHRNV